MRNLQTITQETYDVIVIGGGINGAGVARDAALRGLKTILLEKGDFASGTSSWSTRLAHGGLRYLEYFEFPLVREALREREILLRTAPHLVQPLLLTIPIYKNRSRPYWKIWAGMTLYDLLSLDKTLPAHRMVPRKPFRQLFRTLDPENLVGGAQYYDGQVAYAERLCWENILDAHTAGAQVLNYAEVITLERQGDRLTGVQVRDHLTGQSFRVGGHDKTLVINTSGPWVDRVCGLGQENGQPMAIGQKPKMGGTKGSHIIVRRFPQGPPTSLYVEAKSDGRPFFIVPWLQDYYIIGTTDLNYDGDLDHVKADPDEIHYLLRETNLVIPTAQLTRDDVIFTYSGVRPLPNTAGQPPGSVTRKHILFDHGQEGVKNLISLIGGKLTTYRSVGEEVVDLIYRKRGQTPPPCTTDRRPLPGYLPLDDDRRRTATQRYQALVGKDSLDHLFSLYGAIALEILPLVDQDSELGERITPRLPDIKAQAVYAVRSEAAHGLVDILRRRTIIAMVGNYGFDCLDPVCAVLAKHCQWSSDRQRQAREEYHQFMAANCLPDGEP